MQHIHESDNAMHHTHPSYVCFEYLITNFQQISMILDDIIRRPHRWCSSGFLALTSDYLWENESVWVWMNEMDIRFHSHPIFLYGVNFVQIKSAHQVKWTLRQHRINTCEYPKIAPIDAFERPVEITNAFHCFLYQQHAPWHGVH